MKNNVKIIIIDLIPFFVALTAFNLVKAIFRHAEYDACCCSSLSHLLLDRSEIYRSTLLLK